MFLIWLRPLSPTKQSVTSDRESRPGNRGGPENAGHSEIPAEISYPVIDEYREPPFKRGLSVRLNQKVSEDTLRKIALRLKSQEVEQYESTFIWYFLPDRMTDGDGWAKTDFRPTLQVEIIGLTPEEENLLTNDPLPEGREPIGRWLDEGMGKCRIMIYRESGRFYLENAYPDGHKSVQELFEIPSTDSRRFERVSPSQAGDRYLVYPNGTFEIRDNDGLIQRLPPMKADHR
jgi:hypothetical protein